MIRTAALALAITATLAGPAFAADLLPLKNGIFVPKNVACKGASNADMVNYWGGRASIGVSQAECTITKVSHVGASYTVTDKCTDTQGGGAIEGGPRKLVIASPTNFTMDGTAYKYCGPKVQF
jgi:hypothetical protein